MTPDTIVLEDREREAFDRWASQTPPGRNSALLANRLGPNEIHASADVIEQLYGLLADVSHYIDGSAETTLRARMLEDRRQLLEVVYRAEARRR